jgi:molybdenum cofactor cytidylyltransferase
MLRSSAKAKDYAGDGGVVAQVEGVILAAGLSSRSGRHKMTLPLGDKTVIERSIEPMAAVAARILVVVGWQAESIRALLAGYHQVQLVYNVAFRAGMFSSVKAGLAQVRAPRVFLLPGDHPLIGVPVYQRMLSSPGDIVIPTFRGRKGHPVLLSSALIPDILAQPEDATLREYVERKRYEALPVDDEGILIDLDTMEDYHTVLTRFGTK